MNTLSLPRQLHPMQWIAAVSVTLFALAGIAAISGLLPISKSAETPAAPEPAPAVVPATAPVEKPEPKVVIVKQVAQPAKRHAMQVAHSEPVAEPAPPVAAVCTSCGRIESVQRIEHEGEGSGIGAVAGGTLGGVLGHNMGQGNGRKIATVAGVIGGAFLGNHIEKSQKKTASYEIVVRYEDGTSQVFSSSTDPGWQNGEKVRVVNGVIQPNS